MIEFDAKFQTPMVMPDYVVAGVLEQMIAKELEDRGLTSADIVSRVTIADGTVVDGVMLYHDRITIPGDE